MSIKLGSKVKDVISGFVGVVVARTEYLFGCVRVQVSPQKLEKEGKLPEVVCFDEDQLEVIKENVVEGIAPKSKPTTGGPGNKETSGPRSTKR